MIASPSARPLDVKLMHLTANVLFVVFAVLCVLAAARWLVRQPSFDIQGMTVLGDVQHSNALTLRANVAPRVHGTFFTVDLTQVRKAFEAMPWVRSAVVQREFPRRLRVTLQEHQAVAYWGDARAPRLLNNYGEVFEANLDEIEQDSLPRLNGPDTQAAQVLQMYLTVAPAFEALELPLEALELSGRGNWELLLRTGATVTLGRGSVDVVQPRVHRFLKTLTQVSSRYGRQVQDMAYADLRHENGYALRLQGVSTVVPSTPATP